jgi:hypothetical protein
MTNDYDNLAREVSRSFKAFEASMPGEAALEALERALVCSEVLIGSGDRKLSNFARQQFYRSACHALELARYDLEHADNCSIAIDWQKIGAAFIRLGHPLPGEFEEVLMHRATRIYLEHKIESLRRQPPAPSRLSETKGSGLLPVSWQNGRGRQRPGQRS